MKRIYKNYIEATADFPKKDVIFWDFTPLHEHPEMFTQAMTDIANYFAKKQLTCIAAIEAKGFILGAALAMQMHLPLQLIRKPGLIPGKVRTKSFVKEYGLGVYQMKERSLEGEKVLIVYDILAAEGATQAAIDLVEESGGKVMGCAYVIELEYLQARKALASYHLFSLVKIKEKKL